MTIKPKDSDTREGAPNSISPRRDPRLIAWVRLMASLAAEGDFAQFEHSGKARNSTSERE